MAESLERKASARLEAGEGILKVVKAVSLGAGTVARIKADMRATYRPEARPRDVRKLRLLRKPSPKTKWKHARWRAGVERCGGIKP